MNINTDIDILLAKYFSGEASAKELDRLEDWLAESEESQAYFDEMTMVYQKSAQVVPPPAVNTAKAWSDFEQYMQQPSEVQHSRKPRKIRLYLQVAATVAILIAVSLFFLLQNKNDNTSIYIASDDSTIEHTMPDNSVILLSENSSITYDKDYGTDKKAVLLAGKASFDIGEEGSNKLIVSVGETFIEDIGTEFTVDGYAENQYISVSVESGIVLFYTIEDSGLNLYEGETGYYNKSTKKFSKYIDGKAVELDLIVFDATPLSKVAERLSRQFNVAITFASDSIAYKQLTVSFSQNESIEYILQIVAETLRLDIQNQNGTYILSSF